MAMFSIKSNLEENTAQNEVTIKLPTLNESPMSVDDNQSPEIMTEGDELTAFELSEAGVVLNDTDWYAGVRQHSNITVVARISKHSLLKTIQNICYHKIEEIEFLEVTHGTHETNESDSFKEWRRELGAFKILLEAHGMFCTSGLSILTLLQNVNRKNKVGHLLVSRKNALLF